MGLGQAKLCSSSSLTLGGHHCLLCVCLEAQHSLFPSVQCVQCADILSLQSLSSIHHPEPSYNE